MKRVILPIAAIAILLSVGVYIYKAQRLRGPVVITDTAPVVLDDVPAKKPEVASAVTPVVAHLSNANQPVKAVETKPISALPAAPLPKPVSPSKTGSVSAPATVPVVVAAPKATLSGTCAVSGSALPESVANPTTVVGSGTAESCTSTKLVEAVKKGGVVTFNCGPDPLVVKVPEIKIYNNGGKGDGSVTIDGGNKISLAAVGANRIFYQNTCDESLVWTSPRCDIQSTPHLILQNITLSGGRGSAGKGSLHDVLGGGAVYVRGGTFKAYGVKVAGSVVSAAAGASTQDVAGGAIYTFGLASTAIIANSVFENNSAANGGALGGLFTSYSVTNSNFSGNKATGHGMNPAKSGTLGGGLGGAIYTDGNSFSLNICGSTVSDNQANELGSGSIFMVANDLKGSLKIDQSVFSGNSNSGSVQSRPSIYVEAADKAGKNGVTVSKTTFE
jgi:hypothetical protein